ncbi:MAG: MotA/TolQ/ExbB proton channel family protein [Bacteroidales bacterium]|nr:MotA/TolQ/ExbB proton channel family protein [Bacteroidales bacterium]
MKHLFEILKDGGILISCTILICLVIIIALFIKGLMSKANTKKIRTLISSVAWFAVAWGFLGRTLGLIKAFDTIQASGELTPSMVSGGLKMALVGPLVGVIVFLIARLGMIILISKQKEMTESE